jgi:hypothetical protein
MKKINQRKWIRGELVIKVDIGDRFAPTRSQMIQMQIITQKTDEIILKAMGKIK